MLSGPSHRRLVAVARPAPDGWADRLEAGSQVTVWWACPARGVRVVGLGVAAQRSVPPPDWLGEPRSGPAPSRLGAPGVDWLTPRPPSLPGPYFGGWAFDATRPWAGFDHERWVLPGLLCWRCDGRSWVAAFGADERELDARLGQAPGASFRPAGRAAWRTTDGREAYLSLVEAALAAIREGRFEKVVVAREVGVEAAAPFCEREVLANLEAANPACWTFLLRGGDGSAFVGSSPETLCEYGGGAGDGVLLTDALAGTAGPGEAEALLGSPKDRREHRAVIDGLRAALAPWARHVEQGPTQAKALSNVVHLYTPLRARLHAHANPLEVARALHPTPAVAGLPAGPAMDWLRTHEPFARGWYSGAVGACGGGRLALAVALRSALLDGAHARVFAGAGVVEGSRPAAEWLETERKAAAMLSALKAPPAPRGRLASDKAPPTAAPEVASGSARDG